MTTSGMTVVELFCGAGGMALGLHRAGYRCLHAQDVEPRAAATLDAAGICDGVVTDRLTPVSAVLLAERLPKDVDLLAGGPPCQGLSVAGKGLGKYDPRDGFPAYLASLRELEPRAFLIENVKGLTTKRHRSYLDEIVADIEALGYVVPRCPDRGWPGRVHDAADWGVPQRRNRILIVGFRDPEAAARFRWPEPTHHQSGLVWAKWGEAGEVRGDVAGGSYWTEHGMTGPGVLNLPTGEGYESRPEWREQKILDAIVAGDVEVKGLRWRTTRDAIDLTGGEISATVIDGGKTKMPPHRPTRSVDEPTGTVRAQHAGGGGGILAVVPPGSEAAERLLHPDGTTQPASSVGMAARRGREGGSRLEHRDGDEPSLTIRGSAGGSSRPVVSARVAGEVVGLRRLSPAECAALQGFPSDWPWQGPKTSVYRQVGNACPPQISEAVGRAIRGVLAPPWTKEDPSAVRICPRCGGRGAIEEAFGWRVVRRSGGWVRIAQSWCRECRSGGGR